MEVVDQLETIFKGLKPSCDFTYFLHFTFQVEPNEICVIQQGIRFSVAVEGPTRGYILEVDYQSVWIWKLSTQTGIKTFHQRFTTTILSFPTWDQLEQTDWPIQGLHTNIKNKSTNIKKSSYKALFRVCRTWNSNLRDFLTPTAWFEERAADFTIISKYQVKTYQKLRIHCWLRGLVIISIINWYKAT